MNHLLGRWSTESIKTYFLWKKKNKNKNVVMQFWLALKGLKLAKHHLSVFVVVFYLLCFCCCFFFREIKSWYLIWILYLTDNSYENTEFYLLWTIKIFRMLSAAVITHALSFALSSACDLRSHFCKQCGPRSDCSSRNSLIRARTIFLYTKKGLKNFQECLADNINRQHFEMQVFLAF